MKPSAVTVFCPGHISGYFKRIMGTTPAATGSIGAGIVIGEGVVSTVTRSSKTVVCIRRTDASGRRIEEVTGSPLVESVLDRLGVTASVVTTCHLPIGAGFGLSAAALLATLTGVNRLCHLNHPEHTLTLYAHEAEVLFRTGLGDVAACQGGGWVVRREPGIDGRIERRYEPAGRIYAVSFGPIHTPTVLGSPQQMERVASAFPCRTPRNITDLFLLSQKFARESGLVTPEVREVLDRCAAHNIPASMTMLGNGIFAYGVGGRELLSRYGEVFECTIARTGTRIIKETV